MPAPQRASGRWAGVWRFQVEPSHVQVSSDAPLAVPPPKSTNTPRLASYAIDARKRGDGPDVVAAWCHAWPSQLHVSARDPTDGDGEATVAVGVDWPQPLTTIREAKAASALARDVDPDKSSRKRKRLPVGGGEGDGVVAVAAVPVAGVMETLVVDVCRAGRVEVEVVDERTVAVADVQCRLLRVHDDQHLDAQR